MSILFVLIGLSPLLGFSVFNIVRKKRILRPFIAIVASGAVTAAVAVVGPMLVVPDTEKSGITLSEDDMSYLAMTEASAGEYDKALSHIEKLNMEVGDSLNGLLAGFRVSTAQGDFYTARNYASMLNLFVKENNKSLSKAEREIVDALIGDLDLDREDTMKQMKDVLADEIKSYEKKHKYAENMGEAIESAALLASANQKDDYAQVARKLRRLYKKNKSIFALDNVSEAYITALVKCEEYDDLVNYALDSNDASAIAAVANLYMTKKIDDDLFEGLVPESGVYTAVVDRVSTIVDKLDSDKLSKAKIAEYEEKANTIEQLDDNPILATLEKRLEPEKEAEEKKAAAYVQDAGINSVLMNATVAKREIKEALAAAQAADDANLRSLLSQADQVINGDAVGKVTDLDKNLRDAYTASSVLPSDLVTVPDEFVSNGNTAANENRAMINVGIVDCKDFPKIKAYVSTGGVDLTDKSKVSITDAGAVITDFQIEKVKYDSARIYLICDNSGSMSGSIDGLKQAVTKFVKTKTGSEKIDVITFDSSVLENSGLLSDEDKLLEAVEKFRARGGTNIKCGVDAAFSDLKKDEDVLTVFIAMTDGQDSTYGSQERLNELRVKCMENNVILYTIGLGGVNGEYLQSIADSGMGSFVYGSDAVQLEGLYQFIHNQLDENYVITYYAKNTTTKYNRLLEIRETTTGYAGKRTYSLDYASQGASGAVVPGGVRISPNNSGAKVTGYGISSIAMGRYTAGEFTIVGSGFETAKSITVSLEGDTNVPNLKVSTVSDTELRVIVPAKTAYGTYKSVITIDGTTFELDGLRILDAYAAPTVFNFGEYTFEALSVDTNGNTTTLSGNVVMNGYLHFNGDVTLKGNPDGNQLNLSEKAGSYITYTGGIGGLIGQYFGNRADIDAFTSVDLYKDSKTYDKFKLNGLATYAGIGLKNPNMELHGDGIVTYLVDYSLDIPPLANLLDAADVTFSGVLKNSQKVILGDKDIDIDVNLNSDRVDALNTLYYGKLKVTPLDYDISINTKAGDISIELKSDGAGLFDLGNIEEVSLSIIFRGWCIDEIMVGIDVPIPVVTIPSPPLTLVSLSDFKGGVSNLKKSFNQSGLITKLLQVTHKGGCDVDVLNLSMLIPGSNSLLGDILDISVLKLDDTTLEVTPLDFNLKLSTTAKLFEMVELGKAEVELGKYTYENAILGISPRDTYGLKLLVSTGVNLDFTDDFNVHINGSGRADISTVFSGLHMHGDARYNFKFFGKHIGDLNGDVIIGVMGSQFVIYARSDDYGNGSADGFRIVIDGDSIWDVDIELY